MRWLSTYSPASRSTVRTFLVLALLLCWRPTENAARAHGDLGHGQHVDDAADAAHVSTSPPGTLLRLLGAETLLDAVAATFDSSDRHRVAVFYRTPDDSTRLALVDPTASTTLTRLDLALSPETRVSGVTVEQCLFSCSTDPVQLPYSFLAFAAEDSEWYSYYAYDLARDRVYFAAQRKGSPQVVESKTRARGLTPRLADALRSHLRRELEQHASSRKADEEFLSLRIAKPSEQEGFISLFYAAHPDGRAGVSYEINVHDNEGDTIQHLSGQSHLSSYHGDISDDGATCRLQPYWRDINFDGYGDLELCAGMAVSGQTRWEYYLYYPSLNLFAHAPDFAMAPSRPTLDAEEEVIVAWWYTDMGSRHGYRYYTVENYRPVLIKRTLQDDRAGTSEVYERRGGQMVLVEQNGRPIPADKNDGVLTISEWLGSNYADCHVVEDTRPNLPHGVKQSIVEGNFYGDDQMDYFVHMDCPARSTRRYADYRHIAFFAIRQDHTFYDFIVLDYASERTIFSVVPEGQMVESFDYQVSGTGPRVRLRYDAVSYYMGEGGDTVAYIENGEVKRVGTGD